MSKPAKQQRPPQHQDRQPGIESEMTPKPKAEDPQYKGSGKLRGKVALITGGDSGIGRAVAILYTKEGADVAIVYLNEHQDAEETTRLVEKEGRRCLAIAGDVGDEAFCRKAVQRAVEEFGHLDTSSIMQRNSTHKTASKRLAGSSWSAHFAPTSSHTFT